MGGLDALLRVATTVSSFCLIASPGIDIYRIYKKKHTGETSLLPIVALFANCYLWGVYGFQTGDWFPLVASSIFGVTMGAIFSAIYYRWSIERHYIHKLTGGVALILALVTTYVILGVSGITNQSKDQVIDINGYIAVMVNITVYASPLETVKRVIRTKSTISMPVEFCIISWVNGVLWVFTAIVDNDMFVLTPNAIGVAFSSVQVVLCWMYRPERVVVAADAMDLERGSVGGETAESAMKSLVFSPHENEKQPSIAYRAVRSPLVPLQT